MECVISDGIDPIKSTMVHITDRRPVYYCQALLEELNEINERVSRKVAAWKRVGIDEIRRPSFMRRKAGVGGFFLRKRNIFVERESKLAYTYQLIKNIPDDVTRSRLEEVWTSYKERGMFLDAVKKVGEDWLMTDCARLKNATGCELNVALKAQGECRDVYIHTLQTIAKLREIQDEVGPYKEYVKTHRKKSSIRRPKEELDPMEMIRKISSQCPVPSPPEHVESEADTLLMELTSMLGQAIGLQEFTDIQVRSIDSNLDEIQRRLETTLCTSKGLQKNIRKEEMEVKKLRHQLDHLKKEHQTMTSHMQELRNAPVVSEPVEDGATYASVSVQTTTDVWDEGVRFTSAESMEEGLPVDVQLSVTKPAQPIPATVDEGGMEVEDMHRLGVQGEEVQEQVRISISLPQSMAETHQEREDKKQPDPEVVPSVEMLSAHAHELTRAASGLIEYSKSRENVRSQSASSGRSARKTGDSQGQIGALLDEDKGEMDEYGEWISVCHKEFRDCVWNFLQSMQDCTQNLLNELLSLREEAREHRKSNKSVNQLLNSLRSQMKEELCADGKPSALIDDPAIRVLTRLPGNHECPFCMCHSVPGQLQTLCTPESPNESKEMIAHCGSYMIALGTAEPPFERTYNSIRDLHEDMKNMEGTFEEICYVESDDLDLDVDDEQLQTTVNRLLTSCDDTEEMIERASLASFFSASFTQEIISWLDLARRTITDTSNKEDTFRRLQRFRDLANQLTSEDDVTDISDRFHELHTRHMLQGCVCPYCNCYNLPLDTVSRAPLSQEYTGRNSLMRGVTMLSTSLHHIARSIQEMVNGDNIKDRRVQYVLMEALSTLLKSISFVENQQKTNLKYMKSHQGMYVIDPSKWRTTGQHEKRRASLPTVSGPGRDLPRLAAIQQLLVDPEYLKRIQAAFISSTQGEEGDDQGTTAICVLDVDVEGTDEETPRKVKISVIKPPTHRRSSVGRRGSIAEAQAMARQRRSIKKASAGSVDKDSRRIVESKDEDWKSAEKRRLSRRGREPMAGEHPDEPDKRMKPKVSRVQEPKPSEKGEKRVKADVSKGRRPSRTMEKAKAEEPAERVHARKVSRKLVKQVSVKRQFRVSASPEGRADLSEESKQKDEVPAFDSDLHVTDYADERKVSEDRSRSSSPVESGASGHVPGHKERQKSEEVLGAGMAVSEADQITERGRARSPGLQSDREKAQLEEKQQREKAQLEGKQRNEKTLLQEEQQREKTQLEEKQRNEKTLLQEEQQRKKTQLEEKQRNEKILLQSQPQSEKAQLEEEHQSQKAQLEEEHQSQKAQLEEEQQSQKAQLEEEQKSEKAQLEEKQHSEKAQLEKKQQNQQELLEEKQQIEKAQLEEKQQREKKRLEKEQQRGRERMHEEEHESEKKNAKLEKKQQRKGEKAQLKREAKTYPSPDTSEEYAESIFTSEDLHLAKPIYSSDVMKDVESIRRYWTASDSLEKAEKVTMRPLLSDHEVAEATSETFTTPEPGSKSPHSTRPIPRIPSQTKPLGRMVTDVTQEGMTETLQILRIEVKPSGTVSDRSIEEKPAEEIKAKSTEDVPSPCPFDGRRQGTEPRLSKTDSEAPLIVTQYLVKPCTSTEQAPTVETVEGDKIERIKYRHSLPDEYITRCVRDPEPKEKLDQLRDSASEQMPTLVRIQKIEAAQKAMTVEPQAPCVSPQIIEKPAGTLMQPIRCKSKPLVTGSRLSTEALLSEDQLVVCGKFIERFGEAAEYLKPSPDIKKLQSTIFHKSYSSYCPQNESEAVVEPTSLSVATTECERKPKPRTAAQGLSIVLSNIAELRKSRVPVDLSDKAIYGTGVQSLASPSEAPGGDPAQTLQDSSHHTVHDQMKKAKTVDRVWKDGIPKVLSPMQVSKRKIPTVTALHWMLDKKVVAEPCKCVMDSAEAEPEGPAMDTEHATEVPEQAIGQRPPVSQEHPRRGGGFVCPTALKPTALCLPESFIKSQTRSARDRDQSKAVGEKTATEAQLDETIVIKGKTPQKQQADTTSAQKEAVTEASVPVLQQPDINLESEQPQLKHLDRLGTTRTKTPTITPRYKQRQIRDDVVKPSIYLRGFPLRLPGLRTKTPQRSDQQQRTPLKSAAAPSGIPPFSKYSDLGGAEGERLDERLRRPSVSREALRITPSVGCVRRIDVGPGAAAFRWADLPETFVLEKTSGIAGTTPAPEASHAGYPTSRSQAFGKQAAVPREEERRSERVQSTKGNAGARWKSAVPQDTGKRSPGPKAPCYYVASPFQQHRFFVGDKSSLITLDVTGPPKDDYVLHTQFRKQMSPRCLRKFPLGIYPTEAEMASWERTSLSPDRYRSRPTAAAATPVPSPAPAPTSSPRRGPAAVPEPGPGARPATVQGVRERGPWMSASSVVIRRPEMVKHVRQGRQILRSQEQQETVLHDCHKLLGNILDYEIPGVKGAQTYTDLLNTQADDDVMDSTSSTESV